jgi:hypothetical protein
LAVIAGLLAAGVGGATADICQAAQSAAQVKPSISPEAGAALLRMGQTLRSEQFSFQVNTIRVYSDTNGDSLHIFHTSRVVVRRPNRLLAETTGDDGSTKVVFDGKIGYVFSSSKNKYAEIPVPGGTIEALLKEAVGRLGVDFPLADFLSEAPNKAFLTGVTAGRVVDTVTIDGAPYLHLFFTQPPGIQLELWLANDAQALPRRLIVTYLTLPGAPNFIALFSDWNFNIHPSDALFAFTPPAGAQQVALKPVGPPPAAKAKGGK